jgi:hypothetical protein
VWCLQISRDGRCQRPIESLLCLPRTSVLRGDQHSYCQSQLSTDSDWVDAMQGMYLLLQEAKKTISSMLNKIKLVVVI